jgi:hypothetical protein
MGWFRPHPPAVREIIRNSRRRFCSREIKREEIPAPKMTRLAFIVGLRDQNLRHHMGQILNLNMDREAFASDLADDRRDAGFFGRFPKPQQVVPAVPPNSRSLR